MELGRLKPSTHDEDAVANEVNVFAMRVPWVITNAIVEQVLVNRPERRKQNRCWSCKRSKTYSSPHLLEEWFLNCTDRASNEYNIAGMHSQNCLPIKCKNVLMYDYKRFNNTNILKDE